MFLTGVMSKAKKGDLNVLNGSKKNNDKGKKRKLLRPQTALITSVCGMQTCLWDAKHTCSPSINRLSICWPVYNYSYYSGQNRT